MVNHHFEIFLVHLKYYIPIYISLLNKKIPKLWNTIYKPYNQDNNKIYKGVPHHNLNIVTVTYSGGPNQ